MIFSQIIDFTWCDNAMFNEMLLIILLRRSRNYVKYMERDIGFSISGNRFYNNVCNL